MGGLFGGVSEKYWTRERNELVDWFMRNAPSLGELYQGAVRLLFADPPIPGCSRFIAHAVREISNRLPEVLTGLRIGRLDYVNRCDELVKLWEREGLPLDGSIPVSINEADSELPSGTVPLPHKVYFKVAQLLKDHKETRKKPIEKASTIFSELAPENRDFIDAMRPVLLQWIELGKWAAKYAHDSGQTDAELLSGAFQRNFESFERTLASLIRQFFATVEELDAILEEANSRTS